MKSTPALTLGVPHECATPTVRDGLGNTKSNMTTFNSADAAEYYFREQVETAPKRKAICMLHERCMFFLLKTLSKGGEKPFFLAKAQNILAQLQLSLRIRDSVSRSLFYLYDYCYLCLERGDDRDINNSLEIIGILRDAFGKLSKRP